VSAGKIRLAWVPGVKDVSRFLGHMRCPTRGSALRAAVDGMVVAWTLKKRGIRPLLGSVATRPARQDADGAIKVNAAVDAGLGLIPIAPTCLRRSMTLMRELNRLELAATVHIGVRTVAERVEAHAWVQVGDVVVNDDPELTRTYVELAAGELETLLPLLQ
jgi:hypothetical protein